jgi:hypothetical protein
MCQIGSNVHLIAIVCLLACLLLLVVVVVVCLFVCYCVDVSSPPLALSTADDESSIKLVALYNSSPGFGSPLFSTILDVYLISHICDFIETGLFLCMSCLKTLCVRLEDPPFPVKNRFSRSFCYVVCNVCSLLFFASNSRDCQLATGRAMKSMFVWFFSIRTYLFFHDNNNSNSYD